MDCPSISHNMGLLQTEAAASCGYMDRVRLNYKAKYIVCLHYNVPEHDAAEWHSRAIVVLGDNDHMQASRTLV